MAPPPHTVCQYVRCEPYHCCCCCCSTPALPLYDILQVNPITDPKSLTAAQTAVGLLNAVNDERAVP